MSGDGTTLASDDMKKVMMLDSSKRISPVLLNLFEMNKLKTDKKGFHCGPGEVAFGADPRPFISITENLSRE